MADLKKGTGIGIKLKAGKGVSRAILRWLFVIVPLLASKVGPSFLRSDPLLVLTATPVRFYLLHKLHNILAESCPIVMEWITSSKLYYEGGGINLKVYQWRLHQ